jgi:2-keto-4-pentenoate hydratase/2-oxohepta-3-ene-1,7-dioic acid hydratase in catechol pathway
MFHPLDQPMVRGWVGRIEDDRVVHLAAQTLESFFTGGGTAREHAVYPLDGVRLLAPVLHPHAVRVFEDQNLFAFANPAAIIGPFDEVEHRSAVDGVPLELRPRLAAIIGADGSIGGFTIFAEWRAPDLVPPKDRDFALGLGPVVVTPDEVADTPMVVARVYDDEALRKPIDAFDWSGARELAAQGTALKPGDIVACPSPGVVGGIEPATRVDVEIESIGTLRQFVGTRKIE